MSPIASDLDFLVSLAKPFFQLSHVRKTLTVINEEGMTGWEKWLQIEFATSLRSHENVKAWGRESSYAFDKRIEKVRSKCAVDFIIHQKRKQSHLALELKQINSVSACIGAMARDFKKLDKIRGAEFDIRSVWCLGVHSQEHIAEIKRKVTYYADKEEIYIDQNLIVSEKIGNTGYSYTIF